MTWNAVLVARRGLGVEEVRLMTGPMAVAVRWAAMAQQLAPDLATVEQVAGTDPPDELLGKKIDPEQARQKALLAFQQNRARARKRAAELRELLFPPDEEAAGG
jgi:hypothetical protein